MFVDDLYIDKGHKMKHYSKFYSLENILSANAWWDINLYLFPYLRKSIQYSNVDPSPHILGIAQHTMMFK